MRQAFNLVAAALLLAACSGGNGSNPFQGGTDGGTGGGTDTGGSGAEIPEGDLKGNIQSVT
jgi:hypothetical protein